ncbi:MAG: MFS transporter [Rhizobiaceae bacterium]
MNAGSEQNGKLVLAAGVLMMLVLGSVHAFSVFLEPLEMLYSASRTKVSLIYSLALAFLTVSVLFGHMVFGHLKPARLAFLICVMAASGCILAAVAENLVTVWLGYSLLFGAANGLGYGFSLQISAQANPKSKGWAMGLITACYALGAVISPYLFDWLVIHYGFSGAMTGLALVLVMIAPVAAWLLSKANAKFTVSTPSGDDKIPVDGSLVLRLWIGYGTAVAAGLMAIGHATGIARAGGLEDSLVLLAPIIIALFNMCGSLVAGWLADRISIKKMLTALPVLSSAALVMLAIGNGAHLMLSAFAAIGFSYGAIIAVYPVAVGSLFGAVLGVRIYGKVFTAWGLSGLLAPVFAGFLYHRFGNYEIALFAAAGGGLLSLLATWNLPARNSEQIYE